jgi:hypothetical protein
MSFPLRTPSPSAATQGPARRLRARTAVAVLLPVVACAALAPSAEARRMTCEPGIQWTTAYLRYATKQTVKFTNTSTALRSESYRTDDHIVPLTTSSRLLRIDPPGDSAGIVAAFHAQYGYGTSVYAAKTQVAVPGGVLRGVRVPARRRVVVRERVRFWRLIGQYLVTADDPRFGAESKPVQGLPAGCTLRTVGVIAAAAPIDVAPPQRTVLRLKKAG